jgi:hypothetical protein
MGGAGCLSIIRGRVDLTQHNRRPLRVLHHHQENTSHAYGHSDTDGLSHLYCHSHVYGHSHVDDHIYEYPYFDAYTRP